MPTPFTGKDNATFTVTIPGVGTVVDPISHNVTEGPGTEITVKAMVTPAKSSRKTEPGLDATEIPFEGFLTNPSIMPQGVELPLMGIPCAVRTASGEKTGSADLHIDLDQLFGLSQVLGQRVTGVIRFRGRG